MGFENTFTELVNLECLILAWDTDKGDGEKHVMKHCGCTHSHTGKQNKTSKTDVAKWCYKRMGWMDWMVSGLGEVKIILQCL